MTNVRKRLVSLVVFPAATAAVLFAGAASSPAPVAAECDGPIPSFRKAVTTAARIVIGDVVGADEGGQTEPATSDGWSSRFTLRVRHVPLGAAREVIEIRDLATQPCAPVVQVRLGDRVAIAFEATDYDPPIEVNAAAWIAGTPPDGIGYETTTTAEVYRLLGLKPPETATAAGDEVDEPQVLTALLAGLIVTGVAVRGRFAKA